MLDSCSRFITLDKPIEDYIQEQQNKNIRAKTQRDVSLLSKFLKQKDETTKIKETQPEGLDKYLCAFVLSAKSASK